MSTHLPVGEHAELESLRQRLAEAEEALRAIQSGEVDAVVVGGATAPTIYTLTNADSPYRLLVEQMREGALTVSGDGVILYCNAAFAQIVQRSSERLRGAALTDFIPEPAHRDMRDLFPVSGSAGHEIQLRTSGGDLRNVYVSSAPMTIEGELAHCVVVTDLSRQKLRLRHDAIINSSADAIYSLTLDGTIATWNRAAEQLYGYTAQEALGQSVELLFPAQEQDKPELMASPLVVEKPQHHESRRIAKSGRPIDVALSLAPIQGAGGIEGVSVIARDITERRKAEEALRQSEDRYRTLFNSIDEGFCVIEMILDERKNPIDYRFMEVSPSFEKQTGLTSVQGKRMRELAPLHEAHWFEKFGKVALTGEPARFQNRAEQLHRWYDVYAFRFGAEENRQVAVLFNDITARKEAETRQALLTRELQHRTKNQLAVILSIAQQTFSRERPVEEAREVFSSRLRSLANATSLLTESSWDGASLEELLLDELSIFSERLVIDGPYVALSPGAAQSFALIIHELCTNASKYGAYSTPTGQVAIQWIIKEDADEPRFVFRWQERGGPRVVPPLRTSFGTTLLRHALGGADCPARIDYAPQGLVYEIEAPLMALAAEFWLKQRMPG